jgi:hypothetical protein
MSAYSNQVKDYIERYKAETGHDGLLDPHEVAAWAFHNGLHKPNPKTIIDVIAADISQVFREEYRTDKHGRWLASLAFRFLSTGAANDGASPERCGLQCGGSHRSYCFGSRGCSDDRP